jgi:hypothetical protein
MINLFISHASEDKADFVEPLVVALRSSGFEVWYDQYELTIGDSLLQKISQGLRECDYGVVVLSHNFFRKKWTQAELDGLFSIESTERKVILPIWKDVSVEDVKAFSPLLSGRLGVSTSGGIENVVAEIRRAVQAADRVASFSSVENALSMFRALDKEILGTKLVDELAQSVEGVRIVDAAAKEIITWLRSQVERLASESEILKIRPDASSEHQLSLAASYAMRFIFRFENGVVNSISRAVMRLLIYQGLDPFGLDHSMRNDICQEDFEPKFHHTGKLIWKSKNNNHEFTSEQLQIRVLEEMVSAMRQLHKEAMAKKAR